MNNELLPELEEAERKAWDSLSRYKFMMFGYWAAIWVHLNRIGGFKRANPFSGLVKEAKIVNTEMGNVPDDFSDVSYVCEYYGCNVSFSELPDDFDIEKEDVHCPVHRRLPLWEPATEDIRKLKAMQQ